MTPTDLTGRRYGRLLVLGLDPEPYISPAGKRTRRWRCRCDCGREIAVRQNALTATHGGTRSCGCQRRDTTRSMARDLTGARIGRLLVVRPTDLAEPESNGITLGWVCKCDCGREIIRSTKQLLSVRSCGCLLRDAGRETVARDVGQYGGTTISAIRPGRPANRNSRSGVKGVYWSEREQRWIAKITVRGKTITVGRYRSIDDAAAARREAEEQYFAPLIAAYEAAHGR